MANWIRRYKIDLAFANTARDLLTIRIPAAKHYG
jgi:hypothetical protein